MGFMEEWGMSSMCRVHGKVSQSVVFDTPSRVHNCKLMGSPV